MVEGQRGKEQVTPSYPSEIHRSWVEKTSAVARQVAPYAYSVASAVGATLSVSGAVVSRLALESSIINPKLVRTLETTSNLGAGTAIAFGAFSALSFGVGVYQTIKSEYMKP